MMTVSIFFGSSNLTEAGLGLKRNNNIELNTFGSGLGLLAPQG